MCEPDITYEYRHALIFLKSKEFDEAERIINSAFQQKLADFRFLELARVELNIQKFAFTKDKTLADTASIASAALISDYPSWFAGYKQSGTINALMGRFSICVDHFGKAVELGGASYSQSYISVCNYQLDQYLAAVNNSEKAISEYPELLKDKNFMLSTTMSYIALNKLVKAESV